MGMNARNAWRHGLALALSVALAAAPQASEAAETMGSHGMALFGDRDGLYASHLPMFHAPHDYQVVLRVRLADPRLDRSLRERIGKSTSLWTIDPERFALARLAPASTEPLRSFAADVFRGHFERGGERVQAGAPFLVEKVLVFRQLDATPRTRTETEYLPVGNFLVKRLDSRPDMDHIVKLGAPARVPLTIPRRGLSNPEAALAQKATVLGTVYFETGDLR